MARYNAAHRKAEHGNIWLHDLGKKRRERGKQSIGRRRRSGNRQKSKRVMYENKCNGDYRTHVLYINYRLDIMWKLALGCSFITFVILICAFASMYSMLVNCNCIPCA